METSNDYEGGDFSIDPAHAKIDVFKDPLVKDIWQNKYAYDNHGNPEEDFAATVARVVAGVYEYDNDVPAPALDAEAAMLAGLWVPGGRIWASSGTDKITTSINCYVSCTIGDSMPEIMDALKDAALTQQQGGGIGMDFSTIRPNGANLERTGTAASGPIHFMDMWDGMCATIKSAGDRRGAMMATLHCEHPDLLDFIKAKRIQGKLTNFNISVLVTDAFMDAIKNDQLWALGSPKPRKDGKHVYEYLKDEGNGDPVRWYVYQQLPAKEIWDVIMQNTFKYSEPGVIFIDRVNDENNLQYCEDIQCTNPCGEQPLPPYGCCNLGAVNLSRMVKKPFTSRAEFDYELLERVVNVGVRFLDNVIDTAIYPLEAQKQEERAKRRIGLGITGLANVFAQMEISYGSDDALTLTGHIMKHLSDQAYEMSALLASERGSFKLYDAEQWGQTKIVKSLPVRCRDLIKKHGIRNGVLLTIAPTGTTSILMGNISSGLEPVFAYEMLRKVRNNNSDDYDSYVSMDYGLQLYRAVAVADGRDNEIPSYMKQHHDLLPRHHIAIQAKCQSYIDASISKTVNCPKDEDYKDFCEIYNNAYESGCKGCTTYKPSDVRGSVIEDASGASPTSIEELPARPDELSGRTYKRAWPGGDSNMYIVINDLDGKPFEIFINSNNSKYTDWTNALSLMISAIMRRGDNIDFVPQELEKVASAHDFGFVSQKFYPSPVAVIADVIKLHTTNVAISDKIDNMDEIPLDPQIPKDGIAGAICPSCKHATYYAQEGCASCTNCGHADCS